MNLNELYTQIITENSRSKENRHPVEGATHSLEGVNPSCGDDITLQLRVKDGKIEDAGFIGSGCAISQASASLMIDLVKGRTVEDAHRLISLYFQMIKGKITPEELDDLEDVAALQGIAHVPARVKCAVLAWHTLEEALEMAEDVLAMMLQSMAEERKDIPEPSDIERVKRAVAAERAEGGLSMPDATVYQFVAAPSLDMVPVRVSVSFPKSVLALIDQKASVHGMTRSGFLARAAQAYGA